MDEKGFGDYTFGLIGYPLEHSFSQRFFTELFAADGSGRSYGNFPLPQLTPQALYSVLLLNPNLRGFNVTSPYKRQIIDFLDNVSPEAQAVRAVNTVVVRRDATGRILGLDGFNTDIPGFVGAIQPLLRPDDRKALVLGTGGASDAAVEGLRPLGIEAQKVSRRKAAGVLTYEELTPEIVADHSVIVNATPAGMYPDVDACPPFPVETLGPEHLCFDMIYNPPQTVFLREAQRRGARTSNGLAMLHGQALEALKIWESH